MTDEAKTEGKEPLVNIDRSKYVSGRSASGTKSLNNGDEVATAVAGLSVDQLYDVCDKVCGENDFRTRYAKLNVGMQRMNLGNRLRGVVHKMDKEEEGSGINKLTKLTAPMQKAAQKAADEAEKAKAKAREEKAKKAQEAKAKKGKAAKGEKAA